MKTLRQLKLALIIGMSTLTLLSFQNCGKNFDVASVVSSAHESIDATDRQSSFGQNTVNTSQANGDTTPVNNYVAGKRPSDTELLLQTYGAYSQVSIDAGKVAIGGWLSASDPLDYLGALDNGADAAQILGPDKIFLADLGPTVQATNLSLRRAFALQGYHVNDPTIITPPSTGGVDRSQWLYMYFTMLDNRIPEACRQAQKSLLECPEVFTGHDIGMASSVDGGETWTYRGIVVSAADSGDGQGAWMPAALVDGNDIRLYYSSGAQTFSSPNLYIETLSANGISKVASTETLSIEGFVTGQLFANVDVKKQNILGSDAYLMLANSGDQKNIHAFYSKDGVQFFELNESPIISANESGQVVLSPSIDQWHLEMISPPAGSTETTQPTLAFVRMMFSTMKTGQGWESRRTTVHFDIP